MDQEQYSMKDKPCTKEENKELFERILNGDEAAKQRFIEGNMAYVVAAVGDYVKKRPQFEYLQDDLISEGYLALVKLSEFEGRVNNPQGLLATTLKNAFYNLIEIEKNKKAKRLKKNMPWEDKKCSRNEVLIACKDDLEKQIMTMHLDCHTDQEIADVLGMERYQVLRARQKITKRLQKKRFDLKISVDYNWIIRRNNTWLAYQKLRRKTKTVKSL